MKIKGKLLPQIYGLVISVSVLIHMGLPTKAFAQSAPSDPVGIQIKRIGVMPFYKGKYGTSLKETLDASISQLQFNPENVSANCDRLLTGYVQEALRKLHGDKVVPFNDVTTVFERIPRNESEDTLRNLAQKTAKALGANLIIVGAVWRFRERVGSAMGVQNPASVAFAIGLVDATNGMILWKATFDKTQRSLTEDILDARAFFKQGAKWVTANELGRYGVDEIFKKFPR